MVSDKYLKILVVDDNRSAADALARVLSKGNEVETAYDGETAITLLQTDEPPDVVLTDLKMEPVDGMASCEQYSPSAGGHCFYGLWCGGYRRRSHAPWSNRFSHQPVTVEQVELLVETNSSRSEQQAQDLDDLPAFIANSPKSSQPHTAIKQAAEVPSPVLIEGEIGSGRGFAARTIHQLSKTSGPLGWNIRDAAWPDTGTVLLPNIDDLRMTYNVSSYEIYTIYLKM